MKSLAFRQPLAEQLIFVVDFSRLIFKYDPYSPYSLFLYQKDPVLSAFVYATGIRNLITSSFVYPYDVPSDASFWTYLEALHPDGFGMIEDSPDSLSSLELIVGMLTEEVDQLLREKINSYRLADSSENYLIDQWVTEYHARFTHAAFNF